jgi:hypothetical protein
MYLARAQRQQRLLAPGGYRRRRQRKQNRIAGKICSSHRWERTGFRRCESRAGSDAS